MKELLDKFKDPWVIFGISAQVAFFLRFFVQWLASERAGRTVIPIAFWWLSITGATGTLVYGIQKLDPVIILGQSCGFLIYSRNLWLIRRERIAATAAVPTAAPVPPSPHEAQATADTRC